MTLRVGTAAILLAATLFALPATGRGDTLRWYPYEEGVALGRQTERTILINFYADWCAYCKRMERETFKDPRVMAYLAENFVSVRVNSDRQNALAADFAVRGLPTLWFLGADGGRIGSRPGFASAKQLLPILKYIHTGSYKTMSLNTFMASQGD